MKKKVYTKILTFSIISLLVLPITAKASKDNFSDVFENNWFYNPVMELTNRGIIKGYDDNTFRPNDTITFAEFLKLAINSTTGKDYKAKEGEHWATGVYREALYRGVIDGINFRPDKEALNSPISRKDMAYILIGVNENIQKEPSVSMDGLEGKILDMENIKDENKISILQAYKKGLINGKDGYFQPDNNTTRAEATTVILRLLDMDKRIK